MMPADPIQIRQTFERASAVMVRGLFDDELIRGLEVDFDEIVVQLHGSWHDGRSAADSAASNS